MHGYRACGIELKSPGHGGDRNEALCLMSTNQPTGTEIQLAGTDTLDRGNTSAKRESL